VQEGLAVGDEISVDGIEGTVEELGHAAVTLRSGDGYLYRVPNRALLEGVVRKTDDNPTETSPRHYALRFGAPVGYGGELVPRPTLPGHAPQYRTG
jgi:small-conductance mechanosensitive channel